MSFRRVIAKPFLLAGFLVALNLASGCHSAFVEAVVRNDTGRPITLVEVDYPSASFGKEAIGPGESFHYRFKILGSGATKVLWTDVAHHEHSVKGPELQEGQQGTLQVTLKTETALWNTSLR